MAAAEDGVTPPRGTDMYLWPVDAKHGFWNTADNLADWKSLEEMARDELDTEVSWSARRR